MIKKMFSAVIAVLMPLACIAAESDMKIDGVAAYVNTYVITISDVIKGSRDLQKGLAKKIRNPADLNSIYLDSLENQIGRKLILGDYDNQKEIKIPESIFSDRADAIIEDMFKGSRTDFLEALAADDISEARWRSNIRERTIVSAMRNLRVDSKVAISPLAAHEVYENNKEKYSTQPSVKMSMIVITKGISADEKTAQKAKLDKLMKELNDGGDFAEAAKTYSEDSYAKSGGKRDWMKRDMLRKDLADAAFSTEAGGIRVVDIGKQFCVIKVDDKVKAEMVAFDDARPLIEQQLRTEQSRKLYDAWIARLRKTAYVKIVDKSPF